MAEGEGKGHENDDGGSGSDGSAGQEALQLAQQAAQAARQAAQQAEQAVQSAQQAARGVGAETSGATVDTHVSPADLRTAWGSNNKRSYDEYQHESLSHIRENRSLVERMAGLHVDADSRLRNIAEQALQNAVTHKANLDAQTIKHNDLAIDRTWNVDEVARLVTNSATFQDAVASTVIEALRGAAGSGDEE